MCATLSRPQSALLSDWYEAAGHRLFATVVSTAGRRRPLAVNAPHSVVHCCLCPQHPQHARLLPIADNALHKCIHTQLDFPSKHSELQELFMTSSSTLAALPRAGCGLARSLDAYAPSDPTKGPADHVHHHDDKLTDSNPRARSGLFLRLDLGFRLSVGVRPSTGSHLIKRRWTRASWWSAPPSSSCGP
jgi:hypothetical protein